MIQIYPKALLIVCLFLIQSGISFQLRHNYWFNKDHPNYHNNNDDKWSYCDYKCLYLENYASNKDFVVVKMSAWMKETF